MISPAHDGNVYAVGALPRVRDARPIVEHPIGVDTEDGSSNGEMNSLALRPRKTPAPLRILSAISEEYRYEALKLMVRSPPRGSKIYDYLRIITNTIETAVLFYVFTMLT